MTTDTEAPFLDLHLSIKYGFMINAMTLILIYFGFWMVTFLVVLLIVLTFRNVLGLLESAIMLRTKTRTKFLIAELLQQGYRYHKLRKTFS